MNDELPVYIVAGANWTCTVPMEQDDAEDSKEEQAIEAATKAIEVINGVNKDLEYHINDKENTPSFGLALMVYLKDTDPEKCMFVPSFIALGNGGFYEDSKEAHKQWINYQNQIEAANKSKPKKKEVKKRKKKNG
jgi:hypothetical protein